MRFSVRTTLIGVLLLAVILAALVSRYNQQTHLVNCASKGFGTVFFSSEIKISNDQLSWTFGERMGDLEFDRRVDDFSVAADSISLTDYFSETIASAILDCDVLTKPDIQNAISSKCLMHVGLRNFECNECSFGLTPNLKRLDFYDCKLNVAP